MTVHKVSLSSLKLILIAFFLIFTSAVFVSPADASTDEMVSWSGAADWQAAEERSHVEIDVDSLKWSLREIFDRRTETVEDWDDVHSLKMLESDLQFPGSMWEGLPVNQREVSCSGCRPRSRWQMPDYLPVE